MWFEKFKSNLSYVYHYATAWVSSVWFGVLAYWGSLDKAAQSDIVGTVLPAQSVGIILGALAVVSFIAAKGWPQPKLEAKLQTKKAADESKADPVQ